MTSPTEHADGNADERPAPRTFVDETRLAGGRDEDDAPVSPDDGTVSPGDALRALPREAERKGTRFVSAQAMQARLFSVYDAAADAEAALRLVQEQLTRTLDRRYYEAGEIEALAAELDTLLAVGAGHEG